MAAVEEIDIVIVGGGICGLATALALHRSPLPLQFSLFFLLLVRVSYDKTLPGIGLLGPNEVF